MDTSTDQKYPAMIFANKNNVNNKSKKHKKNKRDANLDKFFEADKLSSSSPRGSNNDPSSFFRPSGK